MAEWNAINIQEASSRTGLTKTQQRGEYLVNNLEHCGTCHMPRNSTMGSDKTRYLSGAPLGNWHAPNITPDKSSGIGSWSEANYVRVNFGGLTDSKVNANDVDRIMNTKLDQPFLIKYAGILAGLGVIVALLLLGLLVRWLFRRKKHTY